jgi:hypothetical protein
MKRYAFLRLEHGANKVIFDVNAVDDKDAIEQFNECIVGSQLNEEGYAKLGDVTFCIAEYHENFATIP